MSDLLVRGGTIVDGTGAPARVGDVRVRDGLIVEIGEGLTPDGEREIDATGALVTPGLIDSHTHYDLEMFWDPSFDPLPGHGVTTVVMGNCGLGLAPINDDVRVDVADLLCFIEELPVSLVSNFVPWTWERWSEYADAARQVPLTVTPFAYTSHNAIRATVMGHEAWDRAATADEIAQMAALLEDALQSGSLGMSSNWFDVDRAGRLVPSRMSDDAELDALFAVLARFPHTTFQVIARHADERRHILEKACAAGLRTMSLGDGKGGSRIEPGLETWYLGPGAAPFHPRFGFESSIGSAAIPAWHELINGPEERKLTLLADPEWRARARHDMDNPRGEQNTFRKDLHHAFMLVDSDTGVGPLGISLEELARTRGVHPSDALADWVLDNGIGSRYQLVSMSAEGEAARGADYVGAHAPDPHSIMGGTDAGAHLTMFCGAGSHLYLLTRWARDEPLMSVEHAVHCMTGRSASFFGLSDRGVIEVGRRGDLAVFVLDELELQEPERVYDLPDGKYRLTRRDAGMRATIVAGVPTVLDGKVTGEHPTSFGDARAAAAVGV